MIYAVKEIFYSLQGEGARSGRAAVFLRFSGCNLWNGRDEDRDDAACDFCDTDFTGTDGAGGGKYRDATSLAAAAAALWPAETPDGRYCVITGGEPLLQLDAPLLVALRAAGFKIAVETNGTLPAPAGIDWLTVSPKGAAPLAITRGDELKLVFPQDGVDPAAFAGLDFAHFFLQPKDAPGAGDANTRAAVAYCLSHPRWRLGLQLHKRLGIP